MIAKSQKDYLVLRKGDRGLCKDCKVTPSEKLTSQVFSDGIVIYQKYKWQKANIVGKKVTSGMDLVNTLTNVVITANTTMELNMVFVRSTNHGTTNITGQNMHVTVTHLATTKKLSVSHGLAFIM
ncbi:hypothetical protein MTR67_030245 [Solanum verrucosum]|uniref:Uncharacterized protein n=1 Tax=Solanum verrucosum TaxID=315347 RepID=A0AAF0R9K8_SOLVR|nr:hypothetical protein MTR67_030245 [Solanum verrucosum]